MVLASVNARAQVTAAALVPAMVGVTAQAKAAAKELAMEPASASG